MRSISVHEATKRCLNLDALRISLNTTCALGTRQYNRSTDGFPDVHILEPVIRASRGTVYIKRCRMLQASHTPRRTSGNNCHSRCRLLYY